MAQIANDKGVPKLADVARLAGVSTATVSRCLNTPNLVGKETRERVMKAVDELGYAPNFSARALAAKQTNTVGAVIPTMENAVFARGIQAFQEELAMFNKTLLVASSGYQRDVEEEQVRALVARGADSLLLIGYDRKPELYEFLERRDVPTLVIWSFDANEKRPAIGFDNVTAMADLTRKVIGQGHRKLACISAPMADNDRARGRVDGIHLAMKEAGIDPETLVLSEIAYGIGNGQSALNEILDFAPDVTAVLCGNDVLAVGALQAAKARGLDVPRDLSITGFDDIEIATLVEPALTTVRVPHRKMGRRAARLLVELEKGETPPRSVELPTELRLRESLGPAPKR